MRNKKVLLISTLLIIVCVVGILNVFAHSGRTDGAGGHRDNNNKSGLGSYHYHCGGYPAHLHNNGVCPYTSYSSEIDTTKTELSTANALKTIEERRKKEDDYDAEAEKPKSKASIFVQKKAEEQAKKIDELYGEGAYGGTAYRKKKLGITEDGNFDDGYDKGKIDQKESANKKLRFFIPLTIVILLYLGYKAFFGKGGEIMARKKTVIIILCIVLLLLLVSAAVVYHNNATEDAYNEGKRTGYNEGYKVGYGKGYDQGYGFYEDVKDEYYFFHKFAVITTTTGKKYHRYGCYHIEDRTFYIYNISNAEAQGYTPCLDCYD